MDVERWVGEFCERDADSKESTPDLWESWCRWAAANESVPGTRQAFGTALTDLGFGSARNGRVRYRTGIRLTEIPDDVQITKADYRLRDRFGDAQAPDHLSPLMVEFFDKCVQTQHYSDAELLILIQACEVFDDLHECRQVLDRDGRFFRNHLTNIVEHPALPRINQSRSLLARLLGRLGLDVEDESLGGINTMTHAL